MKTIKIEVDTNTWEIKTEAFGYIGNECVTDLNLLEQIIGGITVDRQMKPEIFYVREVKIVRDNNR